MITEITELLENDLGWQQIDTGDGETRFRVVYFGMEPDEAYIPEVRELYEVQIFVRELTSVQETQQAIQDVSRLAFQHVSELLNANILTSTIYTQDEDYDPSGPSVSLIFQTVQARRDWS